MVSRSPLQAQIINSTILLALPGMKSNLLREILSIKLDGLRKHLEGKILITRFKVQLLNELPIGVSKTVIASKKRVKQISYLFKRICKYLLLSILVCVLNNKFSNLLL